MRGIFKKMRLTDHSPTLTTSDDHFEYGEIAEGCDVNDGGGRDRKVIYTIYSARREVD